ncbi:MAG: 3-oxoacyl-ACP reductase FabG [Clostridia bacterium]|nr:3-oxoacyl-ACP reductase FabG [Clostridia bacterium]
MFSLKGKVALVTGSSRGIGRGIALALAEAGADVIINCMGNVAAAEEVAEKISTMGRKALVVKANVSEADQVKELFDKIMAEFGRLDILVNNAGTSQDKDIFEMTYEDWDRIIKTNLTSGMLCSKAAMEIMREQNSGRIIFISSVVGERGALFGHIHYAATKSGQIGITKTLARTGAKHNITVNAIAPGLIRTELLVQTHGVEGVEELGASIPLGLGKIEDVGAAAVFLASDEACYVTGATLDVNGGANFR